MPPSPDVLVVGGGIVGLALARELAGRGATVEVVDRGVPGRASPAEAASVAAAGMLAPLAEAPEDGPFFRACRDARDLWATWGAELAAESGTSLDYDASGAIVIGPEAALADRLASVAAALGEPAEPLDRERLAALLPGLAPEIRRGLLLRGEHRVDNRHVCRALRRAVEARGVRVTCGVAVGRLEVEPGGAASGVLAEGDGWRRRAAAAVIAAGAWSGGIAGVPALPVHPVRGQMIELGGVDWPWRGTVRGDRLYAVRRQGGRLLVGATVEDGGFDVATTAAATAELRGFVGRLFPGLAARPPAGVWAGLRPGSRDGLPLLGPWPEPPLWVASGHYRNGILLAPWSARELAAAILGSASTTALVPFDPRRFAPR